MQTTVALSPDLLPEFPDIRVGAFVARGLRNLNMKGESIVALWKSAAEAHAAAGVTVQNLVERPEIKAWRDTFARGGVKPSSYKSSPEQLARRLLKGAPVSTPLAIVDAYCAVSAQFLAPMGAYDLDRLSGTSIDLRRGRPGIDRFEPLGGNINDMPISPNVVVYADGDEIICWSWNHRDSAKTCLQQSTETAVFIVEAAQRVQWRAAGEALGYLRDVLAQCGAGVGPLSWADATTSRATVGTVEEGR